MPAWPFGNRCSLVPGWEVFFKKERKFSTDKGKNVENLLATQMQKPSGLLAKPGKEIFM